MSVGGCSYARNPWLLAAWSLAVFLPGGCRPQTEKVEALAVEPPREVLCIHSENNGALWLVQMETVANELQLTPEQRETFATWSREANLQSNRLFAVFRTRETPASEQEQTEARQKSAQMVSGFHQRVVAALDARQVRRLDELFLRSLGPRLFFFSPLTDQLKVTDSQRTALREVLKQDDRSHEKLLEVLEPAQRAELERLQGEPFDFPVPKFINLSSE
jgi:hypothetical protein